MRYWSTWMCIYRNLLGCRLRWTLPGTISHFSVRQGFNLEFRYVLSYLIHIWCSAQLSVGKIDHHCQSTVESVGRVLKDHFADCIVRSAPYLFGSLQVLFDPVGLIRSVRRGLFDMVRLPLQGLQNRSLASFLSGLGYGSATFVREISCRLLFFRYCLD